MTGLDWPALAERYESGATYEQIALDTGVSTVAVQKGLRGLITPRKPGERAGVARRPGARGGLGGSAQDVREPTARIAHPTVSRWLR